MRMSAMRLAGAALAISFAEADAGVPGPARTAGIPCDLADRSTYVLAPSPLSCQYRFRADGGWDTVRLILTLRDCFEAPVGNCSVKATLAPQPGTPALCACEPLDQVAETDATGFAEFSFRRIGGRGPAEVRLTVLCAGSIGFLPRAFEFTSPDLNGSCESAASTNVADLAIFAAGLSTYRKASDFNCNGTVNITDLGLWAAGLGRGCP